MKVMIEISEDYYELIKNDVENHTTDYVPFLMIGNGIPLSGTNGEVIKAVLNWKDDVICSTTDEKLILDNSVNRNIIASISLDWWNADYKGVE